MTDPQPTPGEQAAFDQQRQEVEAVAGRTNDDITFTPPQEQT
jgi:hypothetical protein